MCVVSNIGDSWRQSFPEQYPWAQPFVPVPNMPYPVEKIIIPSEVSREEFEKLKSEMEALKELLKAAKIYDEKTNQKDCEMEDKIALIKKIAELVGVDMSGVFK